MFCVCVHVKILSFGCCFAMIIWCLFNTFQFGAIFFYSSPYWSDLGDSFHAYELNHITFIHFLIVFIECPLWSWLPITLIIYARFTLPFPVLICTRLKIVVSHVVREYILYSMLFFFSFCSLPKPLFWYDHKWAQLLLVIQVRRTSEAINVCYIPWWCYNIFAFFHVESRWPSIFRIVQFTMVKSG